jgi:hypothetical protein
MIGSKALAETRAPLSNKVIPSKSFVAFSIVVSSICFSFSGNPQTQYGFTQSQNIDQTGTGVQSALPVSFIIIGSLALSESQAPVSNKIIQSNSFVPFSMLVSSFGFSLSDNLHTEIRFACSQIIGDTRTHNGSAFGISCITVGSHRLFESERRVTESDKARWWDALVLSAVFISSDGIISSERFESSMLFDFSGAIVLVHDEGRAGIASSDGLIAGSTIGVAIIFVLATVMFLVLRMKENHVSDEDNEMDGEQEEPQLGESRHDGVAVQEGEALSVNDMWDDLQSIKWLKGSMLKPPDSLREISEEECFL